MAFFKKTKQPSSGEYAPGGSPYSETKNDGDRLRVPGSINELLRLYDKGMADIADEHVAQLQEMSVLTSEEKFQRTYERTDDMISFYARCAEGFVPDSDQQLWAELKHAAQTGEPGFATIDDVSDVRVGRVMKVALDKIVWDNLVRAMADGESMASGEDDASSFDAGRAMKAALDKVLWERIKYDMLSSGDESTSFWGYASSQEAEEVIMWMTDQLRSSPEYEEAKAHREQAWYDDETRRRMGDYAWRASSASGASAAEDTLPNEVGVSAAEKRTIEQEVEVLRAQGLSNSKILAKLARRYHPDLNPERGEEAYKYLDQLLH